MAKRIIDIQRFFENQDIIENFKKDVFQKFDMLKGTKNMMAQLEVSDESFKYIFKLKYDIDYIRFLMPRATAKDWGIIDLQPDRIFEIFCIDNNIRFRNEFNRFILYAYSE
jgi:hypothetical protein